MPRGSRDCAPRIRMHEGALGIDMQTRQPRQPVLPTSVTLVDNSPQGSGSFYGPQYDVQVRMRQAFLESPSPPRLRPAMS